MIDSLNKESRLILRAKLEPTAGSAIQPTGFPDLGAAEFERPDGNGGTENAILVESVQSLANHLEATGWNSADQEPADVLAALPYIAVKDKEGNFLTSSRLEPHRLAGAYIRHAEIDGKSGDEWLFDRVGAEKERPTDWPSFYAAVFRLDPLCLLHGVFFSSQSKDWKAIGNPKIRRAVTAVVEAHAARPLVSGGVKRDDVNPTHGESRGSSEGFGFVPFGRTEYTAEEIELSVVVDLEQIRGYGLDDAATDLLTAIALWEVRSLLDKPLRLRTACDLELAEDGLEVARPRDRDLPPLADLEAAISASEVSFDGAVPVVAEYE
jgi:CRISPR-associated protein Csb1